MPKTSTINFYQERLNLVVQYIVNHLDGDLALPRLAQVAAISPFHFHRIFKALTGETLNEFIHRLRLEKAMYLLRYRPQESVTQIAFASGFKSAANFSRMFRRRYGFSAGAIRRAHKNRKIGKVFPEMKRYLIAKLPKIAEPKNFAVALVKFPVRHLAYTSVVDPYRRGKIWQALEELIAWAKTAGLWNEQTEILGMQQDDPEVTPLKLCRYEFCLTVPPGVSGAGKIGIKTMPEMLCAVHRFKGDRKKMIKHWNYFFKGWLLRSNYQIQYRPAFELYHGNPLEKKKGQHRFDMCIPIQKP